MEGLINRSMRIGIFGGTFDPPHMGHLILANEALHQIKLDRILWLLTPIPPHKKQQNITTLVHRLDMVQMAIADNSGFELSRVDIDRPPPHYAVDTMALFRKQAPDGEFYYLMGLDSLNDLPDWHRPNDFVHLCRGIVVMLREGENVDLQNFDTLLPGLAAKVRFLKTPLVEISGSDIRKRAKLGKPFRYFVPEKVYQYIVSNCLYQA